MEQATAVEPLFKPIIQETSDTRAQFIQATYLHLAVAVLGFILVEGIFLNSPLIVGIGVSMLQGWTWLLVLGGFMFVSHQADKWARDSSDKFAQYLALVVYVVAEAFIFVPIIYLAIAATGDTSLIHQATVLTTALFLGISAVALFSRKDYSAVGTCVALAGMVGLGLIVGGILFGFSLGLWFSFAMVGVASGAILYQTSNMIHQYHMGQYVAAALGLFAAFMLLFWYVLNIVSSYTDE